MKPIEPTLTLKRPERMKCWSLTILKAALPLLLAGCASTHIESRLATAGMSAAPFRQVMVVGRDSRPDVRDPFENDLVRYLQTHGVEGTASHTRFRLAELKGDKEDVRQRLVAANVVSVLFVHVTDRSDFVEGPPASLGSLDTSGFDESRYEAFTVPGGDINTNFRIGARFYRVSDGAVIWSCVLDTIMKEDTDSLTFMRGVAKELVDRMVKDKVIP
jgi:hypothetical protein